MYMYSNCTNLVPNELGTNFSDEHNIEHNGLQIRVLHHSIIKA